MRLALIHNPRSRRNRRDGAAFAATASTWLGEAFLQPRSHDELVTEVETLRERGADLIVINGGDGTVSDVMTTVHHVFAGASLPHLAILPSGNTNLIAGDVGFRERGLGALRQLIDSPEKLVATHRRPLRVSWPDDEYPDRLGMFHGSTGYARAIAIAHSPHVLRYAPHDLAVAATLLGAFGGLAWRKRRESWLNGDPAILSSHDETIMDGQNFLFLATALQHLDHGIWPFWRQPIDPLHGVHYLSIAARPRRLIQATFALLRGRAPDWLREHPDYRSGCAETLVLDTPGDFVLDGEVIPSGPNRKTLLGLGPAFTFLQD